jgi:uncharacterized membrane protein
MRRGNRREQDIAMPVDHPHSTARIAGLPIHAILAHIPIVCFVGAFFTDIAYWKTATMQWANFSAWLLAAGLVVSVFVVLAGLIDFFGDRRIRALPAAWVHGSGNAVALVLSIWNSFVHSRDAYTSVMPTGLILSGVVVLILLVTTWNGVRMVFRHGVGVRSESQW